MLPTNSSRNELLDETNVPDLLTEIRRRPGYGACANTNATTANFVIVKLSFVYCLRRTL